MLKCKPALCGCKCSWTAQQGNVGVRGLLSSLKSHDRKQTPIRTFCNTNRRPDECEKPFYVTTPIFYVNDAPHIGHLHSMVIADVVKRWEILKGKNAILCTGTDEHGLKVQQAANRKEKPVKDYCDFMSKLYETLAWRANISFDHFVRTTDPSHVDAVQHFWTVLKDNGMIYQSKHEGWYSINDEAFFPESSIQKRLDPFTGKAFMASNETGNEVQWTSEKNYHFRLSEFQGPLMDFYKENPTFLLPYQRMNEVINHISSGLNDLSISRPTERSSWGIRVPNDESQTIYVWLDALVNYITKAKYPWAPGNQSSGGWPADLHVIGKDIIRFHCIYWPAFLLAANVKPPKQILSHSHWTLNKQKMSKSTGNVVNPFYALERFGVDTLRLFLARDGGTVDDSDYGNDRITQFHKKDLQGGIGNLLFRVTRPKFWNVNLSVKETSRRNGSIEFSKETQDIRSVLYDLAHEVEINMDGLNTGKAIRSILFAIKRANSYFQATRPWEMTKNHITLEEINKPRDISMLLLAEVIYHCAETLRIVGILLQPFIPNKAEHLLNLLSVDPKKRSFQFAKLGADFDYGSHISVRQDQMLFYPLPVED